MQLVVSVDERCKPKFSLWVAIFDNITNRECVAIANNNVLSGHPCHTDLVRGSLQ